MVTERERTTVGDGVTKAARGGIDLNAAVRSRDRRHLTPELGLREYWYPALEARLVRKKPVGLKMLGEQLVFFRDKDNEVKALWNVCPHRGGSLMHGDCHFKGTISCPYHGWTFDGDGNVLAVLPEGPDSKVPGKVQARAFPTRTLRGMVFVWMGDGEPAPIEEDVPPEFFRDDGILRCAKEVWPVNWRQAVENALDAHVPYVHRDAVFSFFVPMTLSGPVGIRTEVVNGRAAKGLYGRNVNPANNESSNGNRSSNGANTGNRPSARRPQPYQAAFPAIGPDVKWPKRMWRFYWAWATKWIGKRRYSRPPMEKNPEWDSIAHHLPAMVRLDYHTHLFTRINVPIDEHRTRQIYTHFTDVKNPLGKLYELFVYHVFHRWAHFTNFSVQDFRAAGPQRYDTPENLSSTDAHLTVWRRLLTRARGMEELEAGRILPTSPAEERAWELQAEVGVKEREWQPGDLDK